MCMKNFFIFSIFSLQPYSTSDIIHIMSLQSVCSFAPSVSLLSKTLINGEKL